MGPRGVVGRQSRTRSPAATVGVNVLKESATEFLAFAVGLVVAP